jgi:two-component system, OmpR family, phosphate regulon sensor histidine kinase PhoR
MRFRTKILLAAFAVAALALAVALPLMVRGFRQTQRAALEQTLADRARAIGTLVAATDVAALDAEADRLAPLVGARVTLVAADGRVLGDSEIAADNLPDTDNHGNRPEIEGARAAGLGTAARFSTTVGRELLYVAVRRDGGAVRFVRVAEPLTELSRQLGTLVFTTSLALGASLFAAAALAWGASVRVTRRLDEMAVVARRYAVQDYSVRIRDVATDEIGSVARQLDDSIQALRSSLAELSRDRARMSAILAGMVEGVLVVDEQGVAQLANDAARRLLRLRDDPIGRRYLELIRHPDIVAQISRCLRDEPTDVQELTLAQDPVQVVIARATRVDTPTSSGVVLVLHDITDLRRADRIRRDFVANVSHELRTPLTAIRGYVEALLDSALDDAETRRFLEIIARHSSRMERLVKDLLRLTRLDAGQEPLERAPCSVEALFVGVANELEPLLDSREQDAAIEVDDAAATLLGDPAKLHDVFRNLVENASNYSPERTTIYLTARRDGERIVIQVADEGPGIPEADLRRIFERFYRVDKARSRETGGTGLGLSIVKHLVGLHGGDVSADNRPGGGALFTVRLPAA